MEAKEESTKESDAEDEMIEKVMNDAIMNAMINAIEMGIERPDNSLDPPEDAIIKECPLCKSPCRYFNVNVRDRILSCENNECDYPYGHEEPQLVRDPRWTLADDVDLTKVIPELVLKEAELSDMAGIGDIEKTCSRKMQAQQLQQLNELHDANITTGFG